MKPDKVYTGRATIRMFNRDFMEVLKDVPDNHYDLVLTDPPYGIDMPICETGKWKRKIHDKSKKWDVEPPTPTHLDLIQCKSKNQVIWGANHYLDNFTFNISSPCWIFWDKKNGQNFMSDGELAWTSFKTRIRKYTYSHIQDYNSGIDRIHPTQKPIQLYKWILKNYATEGYTIFDGYGGSMSLAIACWDLGFDLDICELDKDYFDSAVKRFEQHISQTQLF